MPEYRRFFVPGGTYFFTVVTQDRRPILITDAGRDCLRQAFREVEQKRPFDLIAIVLLPDHLHTVWTLPPDDVQYSLRWAQIKEKFTRSYLAIDGREGTTSESRARHRERGIWQRRFWEHTCLDENDLKNCIDYIHWNPVKHGLVDRVIDYPWSTFHRFVREGEYDPEWGGVDPCPKHYGQGWE